MSILRILDNVEGYHPRMNTSEKEQVKEVRAEEPVEKEPSHEEILKAVDDMNNAMQYMNEKVSFSYNEKVNRVVIRVKDRDTDEVIKEIPSKQSIRLLEHIHDYLGMVVDKSI